MAWYVRMAPRIEAERASRQLRLLLAATNRGLKDEGIRALERELDEAITGERRKTVRKVTRGEAQRLFGVQPPDEETLARMREQQKRAKAKTKAN